MSYDRAVLNAPLARIQRLLQAARLEVEGLQPTDHVLRRAIVNVDLVPGTALNESDVATQFGVSRTPVREAFRTLLSERLLDVRPQKGTFVSLLHRPATPYYLLLGASTLLLVLGLLKRA